MIDTDDEYEESGHSRARRTTVRNRDWGIFSSDEGNDTDEPEGELYYPSRHEASNWDFDPSRSGTCVAMYVCVPWSIWLFFLILVTARDYGKNLVILCSNK
eukprot:SAG31_NODE_12504_length_936_cov_2.255675_1_plen_101_part_00